jgi:hypothetical protein
MGDDGEGMKAIDVTEDSTSVDTSYNSRKKKAETRSESKGHKNHQHEEKTKKRRNEGCEERIKEQIGPIAEHEADPERSLTAAETSVFASHTLTTFESPPQRSVPVGWNHSITIPLPPLTGTISLSPLNAVTRIGLSLALMRGS